MANKNENRDESTFIRLKLFDLASAFFILALGYTVASLFFLAEQLTRCLH